MKAKIPSGFNSFLTINRLCNLSCEWCYANPKRFNKSSNMSLETVQKSINLLKGLPCKKVILIGGEPTIHPDFLIIVKMIKDAGLDPSLISNSIKFKNIDFLNKAIAAGLTGITTSLKAANNEQYKQVTGKGSFDDVMVGIKNIINSGINHGLSITIGDYLINNFDLLIESIVNSGVKNFFIDTERPTIIDNKSVFSGNLSFKQMADFIVSIYPKLDACGLDFGISILMPFCLFPEDFIELLKEKKRLSSGCSISRNGSSIVIDPDGKLLPCNHFCDNPLGKLGVDFSTSEEYLKFRDRPDVLEFYKTFSGYPDKKCVNCNYWEQCGAGCRLNWLYSFSKKMLLI